MCVNWAGCNIWQYLYGRDQTVVFTMVIGDKLLGLVRGCDR